MRATIYMLNGDVYELPHGEHVFEYLVGGEETFEQFPSGTPFWKVGQKEGMFTFKVDNYFLTLNRDAISHVEWGGDTASGTGGKKSVSDRSQNVTVTLPKTHDVAKFVEGLQKDLAGII